MLTTRGQQARRPRVVRSMRMCATLEKETAMSKMLVTLFAGLFALSAFAVEAPKVVTPAAKTPVTTAAVSPAAAPAITAASAPSAAAPKKAETAAPAAVKKTEKMTKHDKASAKLAHPTKVSTTKAAAK